MEATAESTALPRHKFTVDDVLRMVELGILREGSHIELIEGDLIEMSPQGPEHVGLVVLLNAALNRVYPAPTYNVRPSCPLVLSNDPTSLPEPDLAVVRGSAREFRSRHPRGEDAVLVVEIAKTSLSLDVRKVAKYASAGVPEYWIVDVNAQAILAHFDLNDRTYRERAVLSASDSVVFPETQEKLSLRDLF